MSTFLISDRLYMWVDNAVVAADGDEVCAIEPTLTAAGYVWRVSWHDGATDDYASLPEARAGIESTIRAAAEASQSPFGDLRLTIDVDDDTASLRHQPQ